MISAEVKEAIDLFNMRSTEDRETNEYLLKNIMVKLNHPNVDPEREDCIESLFGVLAVWIAETCDGVDNIYEMWEEETAVKVDAIELVMDYMSQEISI